MRTLINRAEARIVEMPKGQRLMPGERFDADDATLRNPGVQILLKAGVLDFVSSFAPSKASILASLETATENDLRGIAQAAEFAGLQGDAEILAAFEARMRALKASPSAPPVPAPEPGLKPPTVPAPPETKPEKA